jgi:hypothetical protein
VVGASGLKLSTTAINVDSEGPLKSEGYQM